LKPLLALIISILLFAGFTYLADIELLEFVQARFHNPSIVNLYTKENAIDAEIVQNHIYNLQSRFAATLNEPAVRSSFLFNQSAGDIFERSRIFGILLETTIGLQFVQFVDSNGIRIHFSTSARDIISQNISSTGYRNYIDDPLSLPFETVSVDEGGEAKFIFDEQRDRIIFSFPFYDSMDVHRGTSLFFVSVRTLTDRLIAEGRLKISEDVSVIGTPLGVLLGSPGSSREEVFEKVSTIWMNSIHERSLSRRVTIEAEDSGVRFSLISFRAPSADNGSGLFFGRLINDYLFSISDQMTFILKLSIFLTFFLTLYFLLNLKPNTVTVVRNRIRRLREHLFDQLYVNKSDQERVKWIFELEQRRDEIRTELKRNLKLRSKLEKIIDGMIDKSWDELLGLIKSGIAQDYPVSYNVKSKPSIDESREEIIKDAEEIEEVESLEEIDEVEAVEEIEEAESLEEIDEVEAIEEIEEVESLEEIEEAEELEEIGEIEAYPDHIEDVTVVSMSGGKGLLAKAQVKDQSAKNKEQRTETGGKGLLAKARAKKQKTITGIGLLAIAEEQKSKRKKHKKRSGKGLLAIASEVDKETEEQEQDLLIELNIVSPFSSMFASLEKEEAHLSTD
jgi:hypothetical protein